MDNFDADGELTAIRSRRAIARRRRRYRSRLDRHRAELVELRRLGARIEELRAWLHARRCCVAASTVSRYIRKLPELREV
jgi:hypothetical protein